MATDPRTDIHFRGFYLPEYFGRSMTALFTPCWRISTQVSVSDEWYDVTCLACLSRGERTETGAIALGRKGTPMNEEGSMDTLR